jgi:hypothetical protein
MGGRRPGSVRREDHSGRPLRLVQKSKNMDDSRFSPQALLTGIAPL